MQSWRIARAATSGDASLQAVAVIQRHEVIPGAAVRFASRCPHGDACGRMRTVAPAWGLPRESASTYREGLACMQPHEAMELGGSA